MPDPLDLDVAQLLAGYRNGKLSPRDVVAACLDRAEAVSDLNLFCALDREGAAAAARASEKRYRAGRPSGPLDGIPFTVKDNMLWAGHPVRRGSVTTGTEPAAETAPAVERLLEAGAIPFGKTTLPEFGWKGLGDSPLTGIARNPWDPAMTTGGSSAGAAGAAALGIGPLHLGTDGAGSIRIPAAFCGVFGFKPSYGRVPAYPPSPFAVVSHVGPITRSVADAAIMLGVIARPDPRDITALVTPPPDYLAALSVGLRGTKIGWSPTLGFARTVDPDVARSTKAAAQSFAELGAIVEEADPGIGDPADLLSVLWHVGAWSVLRAIPEERWSHIDPGFVRAAEAGRTIAGADFVAALNARNALATAMAAYHERFDLLLTPTVATPAFAGGNDTPPDGAFGADWLGWTPFSYPFNLTLQPAASVPCGLTEAGLPVGLQIVGPTGRDGQVLRAARAFENAHPFPKLPKTKTR